MDVSRIVAEVRVVPQYTCASCGRRRDGDTIRLNLDVGSSVELKQRLDAAKQTSRYMPVGWSYDDQYKCSSCRGLRL